MQPQDNVEEREKITDTVQAAAAIGEADIRQRSAPAVGSRSAAKTDVERGRRGGRRRARERIREEEEEAQVDNIITGLDFESDPLRSV
jgi:hypothetical protein